jgi:cell division transport system permease protein
MGRAGWFSATAGCTFSIEVVMGLLTSGFRRWRGASHDAAGHARGQETDLVPAASIAGRALVTVVAIMTFLASLTAGAAILIGDASRGWQDEVAREMTIQIKPTSGRDLAADAHAAAEIARKTPGIASARAFSKEESEAILVPWLGSGLDLSELPVPRLVVIALDPAEPLDVGALGKVLAETVPGASLDDHRHWRTRLAIMARTIVIVAAVIFGLVLVAMGIAVGFATRGAMVGNREIIAVLHFVGAADGYIARQFQSHFLWLGLRGGAIGGTSAIAALLVSAMLASWWRRTPGGDQIEAMFGGFMIGPNVYAAIVLIALGIGVVTGLVSRIIVSRHLRGLN